MEMPRVSKGANPKEIAESLINEYGALQAYEQVIENVAASKTANDNYALSIWREVRNLLQEKHKAD